MRTRRLIWLLATSLALVGTPGSARAQIHRPANPNSLWRAYPLGTQPLAKSGTAPGPARLGQHSKPGLRSTRQNTFRVAYTQILVGTAVLGTFAAVIPIVVWRRRSQPHHIPARVTRRRAPPPHAYATTRVEHAAAGAPQQQSHGVKRSLSAASQPAQLSTRRFAADNTPTRLDRPPIHPFMFPSREQLEALPRKELFEMARARRTFEVYWMSREDLVEALMPAKRELTESHPTRSARPTATPDEEILPFAAAYADASQRGDSAPMAAVRAIVPPITTEPAGYARRMIAQARRRGLLTSHGRGKACGELTAKALKLMEYSVASGAWSSERGLASPSDAAAKTRTDHGGADESGLLRSTPLGPTVGDQKKPRGAPAFP